MDPFIPQWIVTAGLVGCVVALVVATAQQNWRPRVFFLLALRVAIGWQFLSEGLNKVQSHAVGAAEPGKTLSPDLPKPFSSEVYFRESEGPISGLMRRMVLEDPDQTFGALVRPAGNPKTVGDVLGADGLDAVKADLAKPGPGLDVARVYCPPVPAGTADPAGYYAGVVAALPLNGAGGQFLADVIAKAGETTRETVGAKVDDALPPAAKQGLNERAALVDAAVDAAKFDPAKTAKGKAASKKILDTAVRNFARWSVGVDTKAVKKKNVLSDVVQGVPARLADYDHRKAELEDLKGRRAVDLGRSTLFTRIASTKADMLAVRAELTAEAQGMLADAKADMAKSADVPAPADPPPADKKIAQLDLLTMWTLTLAGAGLVLGLATRLSAVVCGGFLVLTYLTYIPLPWLPNPPATEGNPVYVNKNLIEAFACFALACLPTGRWMGGDGLAYFLYHRATKGDVTPPPAV